jgi:tol-pal system-associated acyl-CoA thioesterase
VPTAVFPVQIYYEDTDHSGVVYHANYLKYFERAREHLLGVPELVKLYEAGLGFVVYRCELTFKQGAVFGDSLEVRSVAALSSEFRMVFKQDVFRGETLLVRGVVEMVCLDGNKEIVPVPQEVLACV